MLFIIQLRRNKLSMQNIETNRIENKEQLNEDFEQEVIAFFNYKEGGIIYVGINKDGQVVGINNLDQTQLQIKDRIKNNIQPSTLGLFDVIVEKIDNKDVIKIVISSGTEKPYYLRKKGMCPEGCYIRIGSSKERMTTEMIDNLYAKRVRNSLNKIESPRQDLTFQQLKIFYEEHGYKITDNFLRSLELMKDKDTFNYNGYLLADENGISIIVARYSGKDKVDLLENYEFGYCSLIKATNNVIDKMTVENSRAAKITPKTRIEKTLVDATALKEAIINAIVHNDYSSGIPPVFEIFSDRFTITSYGGLPQEITQEDFFKGVSAPRNKELMRVFKDVDLVEQLGSGMERIMRVYDKSIFEFLPNFLRINFYFDKDVLGYLGRIEQDKPNKITEQDKPNKITEQDKPNKKIAKINLILEYCKEPRSVKEIMECIGIKHRPTFIYDYLNPLLKEDKLQMTIPDKPKSKNQKYIIKLH
jgi:predicted HTH transcriptional regulator